MPGICVVQNKVSPQHPLELLWLAPSKSLTCILFSVYEIQENNPSGAGQLQGPYQRGPWLSLAQSCLHFHWPHQRSDGQLPLKQNMNPIKFAGLSMQVPQETSDMIWGKWPHSSERWHWLLSGMMKAGYFHVSDEWAHPWIFCHFLVTLPGAADASTVCCCINRPRQRPGSHTLAQHTGSAPVLVINELLAGRCWDLSSPQGAHARLLRGGTRWDERLGSSEKESGSSLLPVSAFHMAKAQCWCSAQIGFSLLSSMLVRIAHGLCDVAWVSCLVHRARGSNLRAPGPPQKVVLTWWTENVGSPKR